MTSFFLGDFSPRTSFPLLGEIWTLGKVPPTDLRGPATALGGSGATERLAGSSGIGTAMFFKWLEVACELDPMTIEDGCWRGGGIGSSGTS